MTIKYPKCCEYNPDTVRFCRDCGTVSQSDQGANPKDEERDPRSDLPLEDIPAPFTNTMEASREEAKGIF